MTAFIFFNYNLLLLLATVKNFKNKTIHSSFITYSTVQMDYIDVLKVHKDVDVMACLGKYVASSSGELSPEKRMFVYASSTGR